jgi:hypothetical protein
MYIQIHIYKFIHTHTHTHVYMHIFRFAKPNVNDMVDALSSLMIQYLQIYKYTHTIFPIKNLSYNIHMYTYI